MGWVLGEVVEVGGCVWDVDGLERMCCDHCEVFLFFLNYRVVSGGRYYVIGVMGVGEVIDDGDETHAPRGRNGAKKFSLLKAPYATFETLTLLYLQIKRHQCCTPVPSPISHVDLCPTIYSPSLPTPQPSLVPSLTTPPPRRPSHQQSPLRSSSHPPQPQPCPSETAAHYP